MPSPSNAFDLACAARLHIGQLGVQAIPLADYLELQRKKRRTDTPVSPREAKGSIQPASDGVKFLGHE